MSADRPDALFVQSAAAFSSEDGTVTLHDPVGVDGLLQRRPAARGRPPADAALRRALGGGRRLRDRQPDRGRLVRGAGGRLRRAAGRGRRARRAAPRRGRAQLRGRARGGRAAGRGRPLRPVHRLAGVSAVAGAAAGEPSPRRRALAAPCSELRQPASSPCTEAAPTIGSSGSGSSGRRQDERRASAGRRGRRGTRSAPRTRSPARDPRRRSCRP